MNRIDVEFYGKDRKSKDVVETWKVYLDNLENRILKEKEFESWISKCNDLFIELLQKMAMCLDYDFDKSSINKTSYSPVGHGRAEYETMLIREGLVKLLTGKNSIPVEITSDDPEEEKEIYRNLVKNYLSKEIPLKVVITKKEE